jgi:hypothetical protein
VRLSDSSAMVVAVVVGVGSELVEVGQRQVRRAARRAVKVVEYARLWS